MLLGCKGSPVALLDQAQGRPPELTDNRYPGQAWPPHCPLPSRHLQLCQPSTAATPGWGQGQRAAGSTRADQPRLPGQLRPLGSVANSHLEAPGSCGSAQCWGHSKRTALSCYSRAQGKSLSYPEPRIHTCTRKKAQDTWQNPLRRPVEAPGLLLGVMVAPRLSCPLWPRATPQAGQKHTRVFLLHFSRGSLDAPAAARLLGPSPHPHAHLCCSGAASCGLPTPCQPPGLAPLR